VRKGGKEEGREEGAQAKMKGGREGRRSHKEPKINFNLKCFRRYFNFKLFRRSLPHTKE
jgi:hypothetical protein